MPKVVITMPAYRAERTLERTVADIPADVADLLILVDDASPDNTVQLARDLGIDVYVHTQNVGYGGNQKTCYSEALRSGADIVVLLHPDYQYEPKAVPLLIAPILAGDADMTFGSRFAGLGDPIGGGMPVYRYVGNRVTTVLENLMLGSRFTELHTGLRAYTRRFLLSLPFLRYSDDFLFDSQLLVDAVTSGRRVVEVPIPTRYTMESSSIPVGSSLRYVGGSLLYCAKRVAERGRRGRRSPLARRPPLSTPSAGPPAGARSCPACGGELRPLHASPMLAQCHVCGLVRPLPGEDAAAPGWLGPARTEAAGRAAVELLGGYAVRGDELMAIGRDAAAVAAAAADEGWNARAAEAQELAGSRAGGSRGARRAPATSRGGVDAVLMLADALGSDPVAALRAARGNLDPEGVLGVVVGAAVSDRAAVALAGGPGSAPWVMTAASLESALGRAGFRSVEWIPDAPLARRATSSAPADASTPFHLLGRDGVRLLRPGRGSFALAIARPDGSAGSGAE